MNLNIFARKSEFIVIGDMLIDHIVPLPMKEVKLTHDRETLEIPYATKILLEAPPSHIPGGNAFTVSMVLSKLGISTGIYTVLGADDEGRQLLSKLKSLGINCDLVEVHQDQPTNSSVILSGGEDRVIFSYHYDRHYHLPDFPNTKYVYLTSLGEDDEPLYADLLKTKTNSDFYLIFSPGSRQLNEKITEIMPIIAATDLLILNKQEAQKLTRSESDDDRTLLGELLKLGVRQAVITKAGDGAVGMTDKREFIQVGALPVVVVENTGAGDTFSATTVAMMSMGYDLKTSMSLAAFNAASVVQQIGCEGALLSKAELLQAYKLHHQDLVFKD